MGKVLFFIFLMFWIRATLPRMRVDRLMNFAWKYLVPLSIVNILVGGRLVRARDPAGLADLAELDLGHGLVTGLIAGCRPIWLVFWLNRRTSAERSARARSGRRSARSGRESRRRCEPLAATDVPSRSRSRRMRDISSSNASHSVGVATRDPGLVRGHRGGRAGGGPGDGAGAEPGPRGAVPDRVLLHGRLPVRAARGRVPGGAPGAGLHRRGRDPADVRDHADAQHPGRRPEPARRRRGSCPGWSPGCCVFLVLAFGISVPERASALSIRGRRPSARPPLDQVERGQPPRRDRRRSTTWPRSSATS